LANNISDEVNKKQRQQAHFDVDECIIRLNFWNNDLLRWIDVIDPMLLIPMSDLMQLILCC